MQIAVGKAILDNGQFAKFYSCKTLQQLKSFAILRDNREIGNAVLH